MEFVATYTAAAFQNIGFAADGVFSSPWVVIGEGGSTGGVYARSDSTADVLLFPSFHDSGGWVVAEALRVGCPVLCLDLGGPPNLVGATGGLAISHATDRPIGKVSRSHAFP
jgi:glycosyltransferase involved in cell wall biosynthesis